MILSLVRKNMNTLRLSYYKRRFFGNNYTQGIKSIVKLSKIIVSKNSTGKIILGDHVVCFAELYSFLGKGNIKIGDYCYIGESSRIWSLKSVTIGDRVLISHNVFIVDNLTHSLNSDLRHRQYKAKFGFPFPEEMDLEEKSIIIEDDAWIAANVTILAGVHVGKGAVIGTGSVVTKDVPAGAIVAGNPAKSINKKS
jgi:acetyltransferase-like isoleucine patch superfamily enzyme